MCIDFMSANTRFRRVKGLGQGISALANELSGSGWIPAPTARHQ
ncbi:hypothetical protein CSC17_3888 [Klebsiella oxytoca]|nr:hypothetical protein CSC17_3888 [Klebsiella oxytoca]